MLDGEGNDHDRILRPLGFVDGYRLTQYRFIEFAKWVLDHVPFERRGPFLFIMVDMRHETDIAVIDILVKVVFDLRDHVRHTEVIAELLDAVVSWRIQRFLKQLVDAARTGEATVQWAQHLNIADRV